jgi:ribosomal protein L37AE/L43A
MAYCVYCKSPWAERRSDGITLCDDCDGRFTEGPERPREPKPAAMVIRPQTQAMEDDVETAESSFSARGPA